MFNLLYPEKANGTPLQYSSLENPMNGGAWWAAVHGVAKSWTWLGDFTFTFHFHALEKEMATYSSILAWTIPGMGEPGGLLSMGLHRDAHDWSDLAAEAAAFLIIQLSYLYMTTGNTIALKLLYPWILSVRLLKFVASPFTRGIHDQRSNLGLLPCRQILYHLNHQGNPGPYKHTF